MFERPRAAALAVALVAGLVTGAGSAVAEGPQLDEKTCQLDIDPRPRLTGQLNRKVSFNARVTCTDVAFLIRMWVQLNRRGDRGASPYSEAHLVTGHQLGASVPCAVGWFDAWGRGYWEIGPTKLQERKIAESIYVDDCG